MHGANLSLVDGNGWTCLHSVCKGGHAETLAFLLDAGADVFLEEKDSGWNRCRVKRHLTAFAQKSYTAKRTYRCENFGVLIQFVDYCKYMRGLYCCFFRCFL